MRIQCPPDLSESLAQLGNSRTLLGQGSRVDILVILGNRLKGKHVESSQYTTISNHNASLPNQPSVVNTENSVFRDT